MKTTCHSEYLPLQSVFLKSVQDGFVSDALLDEQWKPLNYLSKPDFDTATEEYRSFKSYLEKEGTSLHFFPSDTSVGIDSIYCRDASIATDFGMIICRMGKSGRSSEPVAQRAYFDSLKIPVLGEIMAPGTLEGGDVAWLDQKTLAVGHGYRTNASGISQLRNLLEPKGIRIIEVHLPHYKGPSDVFHLMSILSPVDKDLAVVYSSLMPVIFREELLHRGFDLVEVPDSEFESMGCNVLALGPRKCLMVAGNPKTENALKAAGCEVICYNGDHISVLGGGGPTCLTRPMQRSA